MFVLVLACIIPSPRDGVFERASLRLALDQTGIKVSYFIMCVPGFFQAAARKSFVLAGFCLPRSIEWICSMTIVPKCLLGTSLPRRVDGIVEPRRQPGHTLLSRRNRDEALTAARMQ